MNKSKVVCPFEFCVRPEFKCNPDKCWGAKLDKEYVNERKNDDNRNQGRD